MADLLTPAWLARVSLSAVCLLGTRRSRHEPVYEDVATGLDARVYEGVRVLEFVDHVLVWVVQLLVECQLCLDLSRSTVATDDVQLQVCYVLWSVPLSASHIRLTRWQLTL